MFQYFSIKSVDNCCKNKSRRETLVVSPSQKFVGFLLACISKTTESLALGLLNRRCPQRSRDSVGEEEKYADDWDRFQSASNQAKPKYRVLVALVYDAAPSQLTLCIGHDGPLRSCSLGLGYSPLAQSILRVLFFRALEHQ